MIDEGTEELASLYVLDLLEGAEFAAFEERLRTDAELRDLVEDLRTAAAAFAAGAPRRMPSPGLEQRISAAVLGESKSANVIVVRQSWIPWAIAAGLMATCAFLAVDRANIRNRMAALEQRDVFAQTQIAMLSSKLESAPQAQAVVIWDSQKQEGVLKVVGAPVTAKDRDYQLWMVDPRYKQPVDAGVFGVAEDGTTKISFRPKAKIESVQAFAVSLERKGGVPKAEGPMVLVGK